MLEMMEVLVATSSALAFRSDNRGRLTFKVLDVRHLPHSQDKGLF
jgi:hypothetical protein